MNDKSRNKGSIDRAEYPATKEHVVAEDATVLWNLKFNYMKNVNSLNINLLSPSNLNSKIYSKRKVDVLANSMHKYGQLEPIVINNKNVIQSGVLRWEAAK